MKADPQDQGDALQNGPSKPCPQCGSARALSIVYGYPAPETQARAEAGEVLLGGCMLGPDSPVWSCKVCGAEYGRLADEFPSLETADE